MQNLCRRGIFVKSNQLCIFYMFNVFRLNQLKLFGTRICVKFQFLGINDITFISCYISNDIRHKQRHVGINYLRQMKPGLSQSLCNNIFCYISCNTWGFLGHAPIVNKYQGGRGTRYPLMKQRISTFSEIDDFLLHICLLHSFVIFT